MLSESSSRVCSLGFRTTKAKTAILIVFCIFAFFLLREASWAESWSISQEEDGDSDSTWSSSLEEDVSLPLTDAVSLLGEEVADAKTASSLENVPLPTRLDMPSIESSATNFITSVTKATSTVEASQPTEPGQSEQASTPDQDETTHDEENSNAAATNNTSDEPEPSLTTLLPAIVAPAMKAEDIAWMYELTETYEIFPYIVTAETPSPRLTIPANKGREAMTYLSYIIDNYDNLPPYVLFIHGHLKAWHQKFDIRIMIQKLHFDALHEVGYISFRCNWSPSCPAELRPLTHDAVVWGQGQHLRATEDAIADAWPELFPGIEVPDTIASPCCAQFAVTKKTIQRRSREDYIRYREWLLKTELEDQVSGRVMEKLWAYIMTNQAVHCPPPSACACKHFGSCNRHVWPKPPSAIGPLPTETNYIVDVDA